MKLADDVGVFVCFCVRVCFCFMIALFMMQGIETLITRTSTNCSSTRLTLSDFDCRASAMQTYRGLSSAPSAIDIALKWNHPSWERVLEESKNLHTWPSLQGQTGASCLLDSAVTMPHALGNPHLFLAIERSWFLFSPPHCHGSVPPLLYPP